MCDKPLGKKKDLRIRRTYKLLIDALMALLEEKPFEEIHVTDICDKAMIHRTTFYKHFEDKYHLLKFCILGLQEQLNQKSLVNQKSNHPKDYYMSILREFLNYLSVNKKLALLVIVRSESNSFMTIIHKLVVEGIICKLEDNKKLGIIQNVPIPIIAEFHTGALIALARWWIQNDMPIEQEELIKYVDLMINGDNYVSIPEFLNKEKDYFNNYQKK